LRGIGQKANRGDPLDMGSDRKSELGKHANDINYSD
jgi:hypothetical protein